MQELESVYCGGDQHTACMAVRGDRAGDVDEMHYRSTEDESQRVGVVRQNDLHHLGEGLAWALGGRGLAHRWSRLSFESLETCEGRSGRDSAGRPAARDGGVHLILAVTIDKRAQRAPQFRRKVVVFDRAEQRNRGAVGLQLRDTPGARGEMALEVRLFLRRQVPLDEICEEPDEIVAA